MFQHFVGQLLRDRGWEHRLGDPSVEAELWDDMKNSWRVQKKGDKIGLTRWMAYLDVVEATDFAWHTDLIARIYTLMGCGKLQKTDFASVLEGSFGRGALKVAHEDGAKMDMRHAEHEVQALRKACANTTHVCVVFLGNSYNQDVDRILVSMAKPIREWFSAQSKELRSAHEARAWMLDFMSGGWWAPLQQTMNLLSDCSVFEHCGLITAFRPWQACLSLEHPLIVEQSELAQLMAKYSLSLIFFRMSRLVPLLQAWPHKAFLFASADDGVRAAALRAFRRDSDLFAAVSARPERFWKRNVAKYGFDLPSVQQWLAIMKLEGWQVTERVRRLAEARVSGFMQSNIIENVGRVLRRREEGGTNSQVSGKELWATLVRKEVLHDGFRYDKVICEHQVVIVASRA